MSITFDIQKLFTSSSQSNIHPWRVGAFIAGIYIVLGGAYIFISSSIAAEAADTVTSLQLSDVKKGLVFVAVTGLLLFGTMGRMLKVIADKNEKIIDQRNALLISERQAIAGMLASSVAHDINNVLTVLTNNIGMAAETLTNNTNNTKILGQFQQACDQLEELSNSLLQAGQSVRNISPESFDVKSLIQEAFEFSRTHNAVQYCTIGIKCPDSLQMIGYPTLLKPMLFNLILNAAEATDGTGTIQVTVHQENGNINLAVEDDGPGISPEERERIFDPFYTTKKDGTGLGMLSIQACVEAHDGEISITESLLGGAQFVIILPIDLSNIERMQEYQA